jgi:hypothetical protein
VWVLSERESDLRSPEPDKAAMEARVDAAILRNMFGEPKQRGDDMILALTDYAGGCHACGA